MSGPAVFSGTTHQARVIAFVGAHVLAESRLGWLDPLDDTPLAVSAETGGTGDDLRIETRAGGPILEAQAKHSLTAGAALAKAVSDLISRVKASDPLGPVALVVGQTSSLAVRRRIAVDLDHIRAGRTDGLSQETLDLQSTLAEAQAFLTRLRIVQCDVDRTDDSGTKIAIDKLERVLVDPKRATEAWKILAEDGAEISARPSRRDAAYLTALLKGAGIEVKPLGENAKWHQRLDFSGRLLERRHWDAALKQLDDLERELVGASAEPRVWYRLFAQRAAALLYSGRSAQAEGAARRALESMPDGIHALALLTRITLMLERVDEARTVANRAITAHRDEPAAWNARAEVAAAAHEPAPDAPLVVASSRAYRLGECERALQANDWSRVTEVSGVLLAEGGREPELLLMRAMAMHNTAEQGAPDAAARYRDAVRLTSELIEDVTDLGNELTRKALVVRAMARARLDELGEAEKDLVLAAEHHPKDLEVIKLLAVTRILRDDRPGALRALQHPAAYADPLLGAMRAEVHSLLGEKQKAMQEFVSARELAMKNNTGQEVRTRLALAALQVGDGDAARQLLEGSQETKDGLLYMVKGRSAIAERRFDDAEREYRAAIALNPGMRADVLTAFAGELLSAGEPARAVRIFDELGDTLPAEAVERHARALFSSNDLVRAQVVVDRALAQTPVPGWALDLGARMALRRDDPATAAKHLAGLEERGELATDGKLRLVLCLLQSGQPEQATTYLEELARQQDLSPLQEVETAELFRMIGRTAEALPIAYRAARRERGNKDIQRSFASTYLAGVTSGLKLAVPTAVEAGTHVVLRSADGRTREYSILGDQPIDLARNELSVDEARKRGLLGLAVGGRQVEHAGQGAIEQAWEVASIVPAVVYAAYDALNRYHERFGDTQFFVRQYQFSEGTIGEFTPFIQQMEQRRQHIADALATYREQIPPLGVMAKLLGVPISVIVESFSLAEQPGQLFVEWVDGPGQARSREAAETATKIVLTRSALHTAQVLGLLDVLAATYELLTPSALERELRVELEDAEKEVASGRSYMLPAAVVGFTLDDLPPNHPALVARRDALRAALDFVLTKTQTEGRPLSTVSPEGSPAEKAREFVGHSSHDAVMLAQQVGATMYADDLGLRRFCSAPSFSSIALLYGFTARGVMAPSERDSHLRTLMLRRYSTMPPTPDLLVSALTQPQNVLEAGVNLLAEPAVSLAAAAELGAELLRRSVSAALVVRAPGDLTRMLLTAMSRSWPATHCAVALHRAAQRRMALLPNDLEEVRKVCAETFARATELRAPQEA